MPDQAEIRRIAPDELDAWSDGEWKSWGYRQGDPWRRVLERCDVLAAVEGGALVGGVAGVPFALTVPGGMLSVAGIASAWVRPERRGQGLFRRLMDAQLAGFAEERVAAAVLIASEPGIYERFGFGVASFASRLRIAAGLRSGSSRAEAEAITLVDREAGVNAAAEIYERVRHGIPGMLDRDPAWWAYSFPEEDPDEEHPTLFALHGRGRECDGYAAYSVHAGWTDEGRPDNTAVVHELVAEAPVAYSALWSYCLGLPLCGAIEAENRPVDEPLLHMLDDSARVRLSIVDALHLRIFDVAEALAARRYSTEGELVLAVHDDAGGWAQGRWLLEGRTDGADCKRTEAAPDLAIESAVLACVYLGGSSFEALRWAGRVEELSPGAVRRADQLFSWTPAPWLPWDY
ncbi:MAG TPA: GNAT family N-acetyltransferase [Gaiellaceae bacterium]|nr:GNAT family N-acetyltransferase [Gaiellaceae bacterium]